MTEAENRSARIRAFVLAGGSALIGFLGAIAAWSSINSLPVQSELLCQEEYLGYGMGSAYDRSVWWVGAVVWLAFAALALVTFKRSRTWLNAALISAGVLLFVGMATAFLYAMAYTCQG
jgi:hypothetical protein